MAFYAIVKGEIVDGIAIADAPLEIDGGTWIDVTDIDPMPGRDWTYKDGVFSPPPVFPIPPAPEPKPVKTEEEKLADAAAALVAKLIADGVLKQA